MNVHSAMQAGREGILFTIASITGTLIFGSLMGKWLDIEKKNIIPYFLRYGNLRGASAIAAISPVIKAEEKQISVALGCVFIFKFCRPAGFPDYRALLQPVAKHSLDYGALLLSMIPVRFVGAASKYGPARA